MSIMSSALWITLIGMGLVFIALILLWGLMELMMRLTAKSARADEEAAQAEAEATAAETLPAAGARAALAAAAAVAVALALQPEPASADVPVDSGMSVWQAAMRTSRLNQRANQFTRKQRGANR